MLKYSYILYLYTNNFLTKKNIKHINKAIIHILYCRKATNNYWHNKILYQFYSILINCNNI